MTDTPEALFLTFRSRGDAAALANVFDRTAPELGRVAGYLAGGDAERARDLLQATWLTAIAQAARWDAERPLLPWLLGVLANHARSARRAQRREGPDTEALAALLANDDPLRASMDAEFGALLTAALAELPPPFREAVTLHVQHGLTAKEIGEALGRPAGTVRTQIVRGLDRLRALLPAGLAVAGLGGVVLAAESLAQVRRAVLGHVAATPVAVAGAWRWGFAGLVAAAALLAVPMLLRGGDAAPSVLVASAPERVVAAVEDPDAVPVARDAVELAPQEPKAKAVAKPKRRITVHVRHEDEPKVQAGELVGLIEGEDVRFVATDAAGDAVFDDVLPQRNNQVQAFVSGTTASGEWHENPPKPAFDRAIDVTVPAASPLVVRVVDGAGRSIANAEVDGNGSQYAMRTWCTLGRTDANGELRLRGQHPAQLRARAAGHAPSAFAQAETAPDGTLQCMLTMPEAAVVVQGRVVDEQGKPIAAELGTVAFASDLPEPWYDRTDAEGAFRFDWLPAGHVAVVARVRDAGGMRHGIARFDVPCNGPVEVRLLRGATLECTSRRHDGGPAGGEMVHARLLADGVHGMPFAEVATGTLGAGELRLDGLLPGRWSVQSAIGNATVRGIVELVDGATTTWNATAPPLHELRVRLVDERGAPLADWRVQPCDAKGWQAASPWDTQEDGVTHSVARWQFPASAPLTLALYDPGSYLAGGLPVFRMPGIVVDGKLVEVRVPDRCRSTHRVRGSVVDADGQPLAAAILVTQDPLYWEGPRAETAKDGTFAVERLPPGVVRVTISAQGWPDVRLRGVQVPHDGDLDLGVLQMARLGVARLVATDGVVPGDLRVTLVAELGGERFALERGGDGAFTSSELPCGRYQLRGSSATHRVESIAVTVAATGAEPVAFRLSPAPTLRVQVELDDEQRAQMLWNSTLVVRRRDGDEVVRRGLRVWFHGHVTSPLSFAVALPPGDYVVELEDSWRPHRSEVVVGESGGAITFGR